MIPDRYPSYNHPGGHRPKSRRELHEELIEDLQAYTPRDLPYVKHDTRTHRSRSRYHQAESGYREHQHRHHSRSRRGRDSYESSHLDDLTRVDCRGRSRAAPRKSDYERRADVPARSRTMTRVADRERADRRGTNPPPTMYPTDKANDTDYDHDRRLTRSRAPTRASTLHPDDSISNGSYHPRYHNEPGPEPEPRGRSRAFATNRNHHATYKDYPPTLSPTSSNRSLRHNRQTRRSPSITHAHALDPFDPRPTWTYIPRPAAAETVEEAKNKDSRSRARRSSPSPSRTITHPHGRDPLDPGQTYTRRADDRIRHCEVPTHQSRRQPEVPVYRPSRRPCPPPVLRNTPARGPLGPLLFPPEPYRHQSSSHGGRVQLHGLRWTEIEDDFEYMQARMSGLRLRR